jgi:hypothetical protein
MNTNYNIKITSEGLFQLFNNDTSFSEKCSWIRKLTDHYYLIKTLEGQNIIINPNNGAEILLGESYLNVDSKYVRYSEDNKFKFIDFDFNNYSTFELNICSDKYNIQRFGDFLLYEQKLFSKSDFLVDLNSLKAIDLNNQFQIFSYEHLIIITDKNVKSQLYCFSSDIIPDQILDIKTGQVIKIRTSSADHIFNHEGELVFKGNFGEYLSDGPIKVSNESGEYLWISNKLLGPISGFSFEKVTICYLNNDRNVIIEEDNLLDINLEDLSFKITKSNIKDLKPAKNGRFKVGLNKFGESFTVLINDEKYYYFNSYENQFIEYPFGTQKFDFNNGKLSWMSFNGEVFDINLDYEEIVEYSYLDDSLLIVTKKSSEYYLISSKNGVVKKGNKPFAFHRNWGGYVMIDPQPGKKIDLHYYDDLKNKLYHFPFKLPGIGLAKRDSQFTISLDTVDPFTGIEFERFNNPIAD